MICYIRNSFFIHFGMIIPIPILARIFVFSATVHRSGGSQNFVAIHNQRDNVGFKKHTPRMKKNLKSAILNGGFLRNLIFKDKNPSFLQSFLKFIYITSN